MAPRLARAVLAAAGLVAALPGHGPAPWPGPLAAALAEEDWRAEFDALCGRTQDAMSLTDQELRDLVDRCDRLAPRLRALDESSRKVYQRRLQQCRDLFDFVRRSRQERG